MRCFFPNDRRWWGKSLCQPHSGVPVPRHVLNERRRRGVRVTGGDFQTEVFSTSARRGWRDIMADHNLVLGDRQGGKRSYVDVRPMAPSPAARSGWNDPHGSWSDRESPRATDRRPDWAASSSSWAPWDRSHGNPEALHPLPLIGLPLVKPAAPPSLAPFATTCPLWARTVRIGAMGAAAVLGSVTDGCTSAACTVTRGIPRGGGTAFCAPPTSTATTTTGPRRGAGSCGKPAQAAWRLSSGS